MAYPAPFHRLVLIGNLYGDTFNTTLSMIPSGAGVLPAVTQDLADAAMAFVQDWFNNALNVASPFGCGFTSAAVLTSLKLNRIGTDGRYMDATTIEATPTEPIPGPSVNTPPAQLSVAATLRGAAPRARAGKGRMFLPPCHFSGNVGADGRITETNANQYGQGVFSLLAGMNDVYFADPTANAVAGIASGVGTGAFQAVSEITIGRTVDTIRSRRNKIAEDFITIPF